MGEVTLNVPAEHVELFRIAVLHEVGFDADMLHANQEELIGRFLGRENSSQEELARYLTGDQPSSIDPSDAVRTKRNLDRSVRLAEQLYAAEPGSAVEVCADAETLAHALESMVNTIAPKVADRFNYGPMDEKAAAVLSTVAEAIRWAAPRTPALHDQTVAEQRAEREAEVVA